MKKIRVECQGADVLSFPDLTPFQGELKDLSKENYDRLRNEIIQRGFSAPFFVWQSEGKNYIEDGHQRLRVIEKLAQDGWEIPPLPVSWVFAKDKKEAKRKLLAFASQYGTFNEQGLYQYTLEAELSIGEMQKEYNFPEVNLEHFERAYFTNDDEALVKAADEENQLIIVIQCESESELETLFSEFQERKLACKLIT